MQVDYGEMLLSAWRTNNRVTVFLIENLPREVWSAKILQLPSLSKDVRPPSGRGGAVSSRTDAGAVADKRKAKIQNRKSIQIIAGHMHNSRCMWIKTLGAEHGIKIPTPVDRYKVTQKQLITALGRSSRGITSLLKLGVGNGGTIPSSRRYTWRNLPLDVAHVLTYFVEHEGHHRGQIIMLARQLGHRLPVEVTGGIWHFVKRSKEG